MVESRSITAGFAISDAVGSSRLQKAIDNIEKEVQAAFNFSEYLDDQNYYKVATLRDKLDRLIPSSKNLGELSQNNLSKYFTKINSHFTKIKVKKYRKLVDLTVNQLTRVNIIAGGNNAGKTSLIEVFYLLTRLNNIPSLIELELSLIHI